MEMHCLLFTPAFPQRWAISSTSKSRVLGWAASLCCLFAQLRINLCFCYLMRFLTWPLTPVARRHIPAHCLRVLLQGEGTERRGPGSQHRHRGGERVPGSRESSQGHRDFLARSRSASGHFLPQGLCYWSFAIHCWCTPAAGRQNSGAVQGAEENGSNSLFLSQFIFSPHPVLITS